MIALFAIAFGLSFLGSLPPGMISLTIVQAHLRFDLQRAIWMAAGAAFVEIFQVIISVLFANWFVQGGWLMQIIDWLALAVFLALAVYYFFAPVKEVAADEEVVRRPVGFLRGMGISSLNVLVFPFWVFYSGFLLAEGWMDNSLTDLLTFAVGVAFGTFCVLAVYGYAAGFVVKRVKQLMWYTQRFIGGMFLIFALLQAYRMCSSML